MELHDALSQVSEIRRRMARAETFRGYRALTAAFSSFVAFVTAGVQPLVIPEPTEDVFGYIALWVLAALVCVVVMVGEMLVRCQRAESGLTRPQMLQAGEQFLPCVVTGASLTLVMAMGNGKELWMLPGLWGVIFSLGVFSSCRFLPRATVWVGLYYLACGLGALAITRGYHAFSPKVMAVMFGGGQLLTAAVLYWTLERRHE